MTQTTETTTGTIEPKTRRPLERWFSPTGVPFFDSQFEAMRRMMDQWFDIGAGAISPTFPADLYEKDGSYIAEISAPGFAKNEIEVEGYDNRIVISGKREERREESKAEYHFKEIRRNALHRVIVLPEPIDPKSIHATLKDGILTVTAQPVEGSRPQKVTVEGA